MTMHNAVHLVASVKPLDNPLQTSHTEYQKQKRAATEPSYNKHDEHNSALATYPHSAFNTTLERNK